MWLVGMHASTKAGGSGPGQTTLIVDHYTGSHPVPTLTSSKQLELTDNNLGLAD